MRRALAAFRLFGEAKYRQPNESRARVELLVWESAAQTLERLSGQELADALTIGSVRPSVGDALRTHLRLYHICCAQLSPHEN